MNLHNPKFLKQLSEAAHAAFQECSDPNIDPAYAKIEAGAIELIAYIRGPQFTDISTPRAKAERELMEKAMDIYDCYPRKVGRPAAIKAILKVLRGGMDWRDLKTRTQFYEECVSRWPDDYYSFIPHPATWFNQERFNDDPKTWERKPVARKPDQPTPQDRALDDAMEKMRRIW